MSFIGKKFPDLHVDAIDKNGKAFTLNVLEEAVNNRKKVLLFWYPKDFSSVCPSEIHAFEAALPEFEKRNTMVIGASCDTTEVHLAWLNSPKGKGGIEGVSYPLLADTNRNLSGMLGILDITSETYHEETDSIIYEGSNVPYRATYLIDEGGMVFHESMNFMLLTRNTRDFLRFIDMHTRFQKHGEICPANWEL